MKDNRERTDFAVPTVCGYFVHLPAGQERRMPTCPECLEKLAGRKSASKNSGKAHPSMSHWVYVVRCADDTLYAGYTTDVLRRVRAHNAGQGAKYTRGRLPVALVYRECCAGLQAALAREREIKRLSRAQKIRLICAYAKN